MSKKSTAIIVALIVVLIAGTISLWCFLKKDKSPVASNQIGSEENIVTDDNNGKVTSSSKAEITDDTTKSLVEKSKSGKNTDTDYLTADEKDFAELTDLLGKTNGLWGPFDYSYDASNAYQTILSGLFRPYGGIPLYSFYYDKEPEVFEASNYKFEDSPESERDPLQKFGKNYQYSRVSADEIDCLIEKVFNVKPDRSNATVYSEYGDCDSYYYDGYYYYSTGDGGDCGTFPTLSTRQKDSDNVYTVKFDILLQDDKHTYDCSETVVCALKNIDGKKQWSIFSMKIDEAS